MQIVQIFRILLMIWSETFENKGNGLGNFSVDFGDGGVSSAYVGIFWTFS